jgi:hypothetical protein
MNTNTNTTTKAASFAATIEAWVATADAAHTAHFAGDPQAWNRMVSALWSVAGASQGLLATLREEEVI